MVKITEDEFGIFVTKLPASSGPEIVKRFTFSNTNGVIAQVRGYDKLKCDYWTIACSYDFIFNIVNTHTQSGYCIATYTNCNGPIRCFRGHFA